MKTAIVYWSGTGNTQEMANYVEKGAKAAGAEVSIFTAGEFDAASMAEFDTIAFGCPSMGNEELEECEFAPMFEACEPKLSGKKIALFGSYGWGGGEWMRSWEERCQSQGAMLVADSVIANGAPDAVAQALCEEMGAALAKN